MEKTLDCSGSINSDSGSESQAEVLMICEHGRL